MDERLDTFQAHSQTASESVARLEKRKSDTSTTDRTISAYPAIFFPAAKSTPPPLPRHRGLPQPYPTQQLYRSGSFAKMARSTQTSPAPRPVRSTKSSQRQHSPPPPPRLSLSEDEEEDDTDSSDDGMEVDQRGRAASSSCSAPDSDKPMDDDLINDPAFFRDIAKAATQASRIVAQAEGPLRLSPRKAMNGTSPDNLQTLYAILLDSVRRSDLLRKEFSEFVPQDMRRSLQVPKAISKTFLKKRAQKFLDFVSITPCHPSESHSNKLLTVASHRHTFSQYRHYVRATRLRNVDQNLLHVSAFSHCSY